MSQRVLGGASTHGQYMTVEKCAAFCAGLTLFGLDYARECFCGDAYTSRTPKANEECYTKCTGSPSQLSGARDHIAIFGAQCKFLDVPTFNGWHGELVCPS